MCERIVNIERCEGMAIHSLEVSLTFKAIQFESRILRETPILPKMNSSQRQRLLFNRYCDISTLSVWYCLGIAC